MTGDIVARRYARALFALSRGKGLAALENCASALSALRLALDLSPDLREAFKNPAFTAAEKKKILETLAPRLDMRGTVLVFCKLLADKNRLRDFSAIADSFNALLDAEKNIVRGELYTAVPLDDAQKAELSRRLGEKGACELELKFNVSPEILGGLVLRIGDRVMDASLRAQLTILKDAISKGE
ncbi:MAG: F0F1 ATP synthase subunit delta [Desulfovibrio sp.]|nr:F0F1 ATP synthase subunit delta [Desulfovibrio sp.]